MSDQNYEFECEECGAKGMFMDEGARMLKPCDACGEITEWSAVTPPRERRETEL